MAYPIIFIPGIMIWGLFCYFFLFKSAKFNYQYPLTSAILNAGFVSGRYKQYILKILRLLFLLSLIFLGGRLQLVDSLSHVSVDGVAIMMSIDVSDSMNLIDDPRDPTRRIDAAKREALNFIKKRLNDEIGLVIFGADFLTLSLTTLDKKFLQSSVEKISQGLVDPRATALGKGLAAAILRLKDVKSKSKIIILLTDGKPTAAGDIPVEKTIEMAKEYGIKVYAIGIGAAVAFTTNMFGQLVQCTMDGSLFDELLLKKIANETGGRYFHAKNPKDIKAVYESIDKLEKTNQEANLFEKYADIYWPFLIIALFCLLLEFILRSFFWKSLA